MNFQIEDTQHYEWKQTWTKYLGHYGQGRPPPISLPESIMNQDGLDFSTVPMGAGRQRYVQNTEDRWFPILTSLSKLLDVKVK